jgi:hypothetical protein
LDEKDSKEIKVPDIGPNVIESVRFVYDNWKPIGDREYKHTMADGNEIEDKTDDDGFLQERNFASGGGKVALKATAETGGKSSSGSNPDPLPALDLRNRNEGGKGPLKKWDSRKDLVEQLQKMLKELKYPLGDTGTNNDGVDGDFRTITQTAVEDFQKAHKDWEGKSLLIDGRVGPMTADALNRVLVGIWYDSYETPIELTGTLKLVTVTEKVAVEKGINL